MTGAFGDKIFRAVLLIAASSMANASLAVTLIGSIACSVSLACTSAATWSTSSGVRPRQRLDAAMIQASTVKRRR